MQDAVADVVMVEQTKQQPQEIRPGETFTVGTGGWQFIMMLASRGILRSLFGRFYGSLGGQCLGSSRGWLAARGLSVKPKHQRRSHQI